MARKGGGGGSGGGGSGESSNTGLIVTLVFFVLLSIGLGITTYFGYDGQSKYQGEAKSATAAKKKAETERDEEAVQKLTLKIATGNFNAQSDPKALSALKGAAANNEAFQKTVSSLGGIKWNASQERPEQSYADLLLETQRKESDASKAKKQAEKDLQAKEDELKTARDEFNAKLKKANDDLAKTQADLNAAQAKKSEEFLASTQKTDQVSKELADEKQKRADDQVKAGQDTRTNAAKIKSLIDQNEQIRAKITPEDTLGNEKPKGKVLRVDRANGLVYIDLGSADFVKPLLAFAVIGADTTGRSAASKDRKAAIEIVSVLEPHLSSARITDSANAIRDPILAGDLLFNPAWSPNQREHVALAGIIDLDGNGKDDTAEVIRFLERQGIVVDAHIDLREKAIKGTGITERTSYLVLGERPTLPASVAADTNNPLVVAFLDVAGKIGDMENKAKELGVQRVPYRRFLAMVGYKVPKMTKPGEFSAATYLRIAVGSAGTEEKEKPKEK